MRKFESRPPATRPTVDYSIPYSLETDWPVGAAGFEPLHLGLQLAQDSQPGREDTRRPARICEISRYRASFEQPSYLTRLRRTGWLGRRDSNLCILESVFAQTLSPGGQDSLRIFGPRAAGAGGFEPLHFRMGIRQDSQPGRRDSNLCISKSSKRRIWTVSWSPQAVQ